MSAAADRFSPKAITRKTGTWYFLKIKLHQHNPTFFTLYNKKLTTNSKWCYFSNLNTNKRVEHHCNVRTLTIHIDDWPKSMEIAKSSNVSAIGEWKLPGGQNGGLTVNVYGSVAYDVSQKHNASFKFTINRHIRGLYVYKGAPTLRRSFARPVCC